MVVTVDRNRWVRNPEDFAVDVRQRDISGLFKKAIFIEEGTVGLHLIQGRFDFAGRYSCILRPLSDSHSTSGVKPLRTTANGAKR